MRLSPADEKPASSVRKYCAYALLTSIAVLAIDLKPVPAGDIGDANQRIQWASTLEYQYNAPAGGDYSGYHALGEPDAFPPGNLHPKAFRLNDTRLFGALEVGFKTPQHVSHIVVVENHLPGRIQKIKLIDEAGKIYIVYRRDVEPVQEFFRTLVINLPGTPYKVKGMEIDLNTIPAPGYSQIDAVGIINTANGREIEDLFAGANYNLTPVMAFSAQKILLNDRDAPSYKAALGWTTASDVLIVGVSSTKQISDCYFSHDSSVLLMTLRKYDGNGDQDLYVSKKVGTGHYSSPVSLGDAINSPGEDFAPALSPDMNILYFASSGHAGYGDSDIFISYRKDDSWTNWSEPENMGSAINTANGESYFSPDVQNRHAYFLSNDGAPHSNVFSIRMVAEDPLPVAEPLVALYGSVVNRSTQQGAAAKLVFSDPETGTQYHTYTQQYDGHYYVMVPRRNTYQVEIKAEDFFFLSESVEVDFAETKEAMKNFELDRLEKGAVITLNSIYFEQGKSRVLEKSYPFLEDLLYFLWEHPELKIELMGHTDNQGSPKTSMQLSLERVNRIKAFLESNKVNPRRIKASGYGATRPYAPNDTEENRMKNRRVEIKVLDY